MKKITTGSVGRILHAEVMLKKNNFIQHLSTSTKGHPNNSIINDLNTNQLTLVMQGVDKLVNVKNSST